MQKYEYHVILLTPSMIFPGGNKDGEGVVQAMVDAVAAEGWHLHSVAPVTSSAGGALMLFFDRPTVVGAPQ